MGAARTPALAFLIAVSVTVLTVVLYLWTFMTPLISGLDSQGGLSTAQISLAIAVPIVAGSGGRILLGVLADQYGADRILMAALVLLVVPLLLLKALAGYMALLLAGLLLGLAGAVFAAGVPFVAHRAEPNRRGLALGLYGMGNIGLVLALLGRPVQPWLWVPVVLLLALLTFLAARLVPSLQDTSVTRSIGSVFREPRLWLFSFWYFITFGGFAAFAGYLPRLYADSFVMDPGAAIGPTIRFALVAALVRPVGGWLADRIGGKQVASCSLLSIAALAALLTLALPYGPFQAVMAALALFFGLGSGAIFQLVAQHFPHYLGTAGGIVGAAGGIGSLFPPLLMIALRDRLGTYTLAFVLLAVAAALAWFTVGAMAEKEVPWQRPRESEALIKLERIFASRAAMGAFLLTVLLLALVYVGTDRLHHFDPALYGYAVATLVAIIGMTIRLTAWLMRPATRMLARQSLKRLFFKVTRRPKVTNPVPAGVGRWFEGRHHPGGYMRAREQLPESRGGFHLPATPGGDPGLAPEQEPDQGVPSVPGPVVATRVFVTNIMLNLFIFRRGFWRGIQHFLLMWGILGSFAITIPLVFGWLHFEAVGQTSYRVVAFGFALFTMPVHGLLAGLIYHGLSLSAVLTLVGASLMLLRRLLDKDARVDQRVEYDLFPLYLILSVTVTGLALTVSHMWGGGWGYPVISVIHQITVVFLLLYLPFGKLFHIPMRALAVGTELYHEVGAHEGLMACARCLKVYATRRQIRDVIQVLAESGMALMAADGKTYLAEYCPECRRVIRGLLYSRRELRPEESGSPRPVMESGSANAGDELSKPLTV